MEMQPCKVCQEIFTGKQRIREPRPHHQSKDDILAAANSGCRLCKLITKSPGFEHFKTSESFEAEWYLSPLEEEEGHGATWFRLTIDAMDDEEEEEIDTAYFTSVAPQECKDLDQQGHVWIPKSGIEVKSPEAPVFPPAWAFTLVPATNFSPKDLQYEPPSGTHDPRMWSLAKGWLDKCQKTHPDCSASRNPTFRPTRLVEILDTKTVRVLERNSATPLGPYAAFSHCWGRTKTLKLLEENKALLKTSIRIADLPQSYKEALDVAMRFGINYIWIDSLCIVQNSVSDWRAEAATMKDVYGNALITIAASAASENSEASFRRRDPRIIQHLRVTPKWQGIIDMSYVVVSMDAYNQEIEASPLRRRSWVLQESFLSPRTLSMSSSQLWWECRKALFCEAWPNGVPKRLRYSYPAATETNIRTKAYHHLWCDLVEKYMKCGITVFSDKMIAMAGLASHFQPLLANDEYTAGFWRSQLPKTLCWTVNLGHSGFKTYRPAQYRAPSWSWASVEGHMYFYHKTHGAQGSSSREVCKVLNVGLVRAGPSPTGDLKGGYIKMRGRLLPVQLVQPFLTVPDENGIYRYIKGSAEDENKVVDEDVDRTWVDLDENTSDEWPVISHLDTLGVDIQNGGYLDTAKRVATFAQVWDGQLFSLPIIEWVHLEKPRVAGIILGHAKGEPDGRMKLTRVPLQDAASLPPVALEDAEHVYIFTQLNVDKCLVYCEAWKAKHAIFNVLLDALFSTRPDLDLEALVLEWVRYGFLLKAQDGPNGKPFAFQLFSPSETEGIMGTYASLSHCWARGPKPIVTTSDTIAYRLKGITFTARPKTFGDAVLIARRLGLRYIWIDSLCIIQNSAEDWQIESSKMADIYHNSFVTIAAVSSPDSRGGCFSPEKLSDLCFRVEGEGFDALIAAR
ncbi:hypothetical protein FZEAL_7521 [Fusarium zealandicum]|uniref:Heterokaryon incompatibility domain-containing protein n=1 Tax=Fusarium zealandicum TaxID=1053134 RepID=A0A8H4UFL9_9HYPO|nr:hypothetical protein FZEAL_7521 [Fusarium zealandicum]